MNRVICKVSSTSIGRSEPSLVTDGRGRPSAARGRDAPSRGLRVLALAFGVVATAATATLAQSSADLTTTDLIASEADHALFAGMIDDIYDGWSTDGDGADLDKVYGYYATDDALIVYDVMEPLEGFVGPDGWRSLVEETFYAGSSEIVLTRNDDLRVRRAGDVAWTAHTFRVEAEPEGAEPQAFDARHTIVWVRRGEGWLAVHEHASLPIQEN